MQRPLADKRLFGPITDMYSQENKSSSLVYYMHVPRGDEGQLISNINPDYPNADVTISEATYQGENTKFIGIDTHQQRLNVQNSVLQFQSIAEVDVKFLWPKDTTLLSSNGEMYWSFELDEPITEEKFQEFKDDPTNNRFGPKGFKLNYRGDALYKRVNEKVGVRDTKRGLIRSRSFIYDTILTDDTPSIPLREGRNSDILTCVKP